MEDCQHSPAARTEGQNSAEATLTKRQLYQALGELQVRLLRGLCGEASLDPADMELAEDLATWWSSRRAARLGARHD